MSLSPRQQKMYRDLVARAWLAQCDRDGLPVADRAAKDAWYRRQLMDVLGIWTTKECNPTDDLDWLLIRFAQIAGDEKMIAHATASAERRVKFRLAEAMRVLSELEHRSVAWSYVVAILEHMHLPADVNDCPAALLRKVLQAIATHIRRLKRKAGEVDHAA